MVKFQFYALKNLCLKRDSNFLYRKWIPLGWDSIYRAISEALFMTQRYHGEVQAHVENFLKNTAEGQKLATSDEDHKAAQAAAKVFNINLEVLLASDNLGILAISPDYAIYTGSLEDSSDDDDDEDS